MDYNFHTDRKKKNISFDSTIASKREIIYSRIRAVVAHYDAKKKK